MEAPLHRHVREVAFRDTDASGWMHFPNVFHYFEAAEHEFLRSKGLLVFEREQGGWPRVKASCDYRRPMLGGDVIQVDLKVTRLGTTSVDWEFEITGADGETAALGSVTTVRVNGMGRPQAISDEERLALAPRS